MWLCVCTSNPVTPPSLCRRCPGEAAVYVGEVISSSTSKEAHDLRTCREHGALFARLPEVPRPSQPCSNGRALPAVRDATCPPPPPQPNHRGAQQDPGPHHAEVWEVRIKLSESVLKFWYSDQSALLGLYGSIISFISIIIQISTFHEKKNQIGFEMVYLAQATYLRKLYLTQSGFCWNDCREKNTVIDKVSQMAKCVVFITPGLLLIEEYWLHPLSSASSHLHIHQ